jgi:hypothetical protein
MGEQDYDLLAGYKVITGRQEADGLFYNEVLSGYVFFGAKNKVFKFQKNVMES